MLVLAHFGLVLAYWCLCQAAIIELSLLNVLFNLLLLFLAFCGFAVLGDLIGSILCLCRKVPRSVVILGMLLSHRRPMPYAVMLSVLVRRPFITRAGPGPATLDVRREKKT